MEEIVSIIPIVASIFSIFVMVKLSIDNYYLREQIEVYKDWVEGHREINKGYADLCEDMISTQNEMLDKIKFLETQLTK